MNLSVQKGNISLKLGVKAKLAERAAFHREKWMVEEQSKSKQWNAKLRKWVKKKSKWGYLRRIIDENFPSLVSKPNDVSALFS